MSWQPESLLRKSGAMSVIRAKSKEPRPRMVSSGTLERWARWMGAMMLLSRHNPVSLLDNAPLRELLEKNLPMERIQVHLGVNRIVDTSTFFYFQEVTLPRDDAPACTASVDGSPERRCIRRGPHQIHHWESADGSQRFDWA